MIQGHRESTDLTHPWIKQIRLVICILMSRSICDICLMQFFFSDKKGPVTRCNECRKSPNRDRE